MTQFCGLIITYITRTSDTVMNGFFVPFETTQLCSLIVTTITRISNNVMNRFLVPFFLIAVHLFTGLEIKCSTIKIIHIKKKIILFHIHGVCRPVDVIAPRYPQVAGTVRVSTLFLESALPPPSSRSGNRQEKFSRQ